MISRTATNMMRLQRLGLRSLRAHQVQQLRRYSSTPEAAPTTKEFYSTFGRPIAKCLLLAMLTYQAIYFGWTKLEQDEIKAGKQAEITALEAQVAHLQKSASNSEKQA
ncbi:hypothetical protein QBC46DRAFT_372697 [Diplogelasinospora grovesii]|uniref:Inner membrane assembly complex subunit 17 n=1 Tax=Diplogelasinospora grovesii TaxID=303347 RepID=A0AAN6NJC4_9PEZI|nr:hypothetical protein QBC46DRAFT_372697 [Diplogelasinospora grovesii]